MVVAQEGRAALIGAEVLKRGGNAVDAAVAVGFAMAVTYPRAGNIGGGGFMLIHLARGKKDIAIDYRETAPAATTKDTFLNAQGEADPAKSRDLGLAIGVPGTVAGLTLALAEIRLGQIQARRSSSRRRSIWRATATRPATNSRTPAARRSRAWRAGPRPRSCSSSPTAR